MMLEYGDAYLERSEAAGCALRSVLSDDAYRVALAMAPESQATEAAPPRLQRTETRAGPDAVTLG